MSGYLPTVGSDPALVLSPLPHILRGQSGAERSGLSLDERVGETGDGVAQHHLPAFGLINGKWLCAFDEAEHQRRFCLTEVGFLFFWFLHLKLWNSSLLGSPAAAPLLKSLQLVVTFTRLASSSPVVMATANRKCPAAGNASGLVPVCRSLLAGGNLAHYRCSVFPSAPTMPPFFAGRWEQPRSWTVNAVWIKTLCPSPEIHRRPWTKGLK